MKEDALQHRREVVGVYRRVTAIVWQRLSPTFGLRTINAIARNVIARRATEHPALAAVKVGADGLEWDRLEARLGEYPAKELRAALDDLVDDFFEALATLIGRLVVGKIFKEAEAAAKKGEDE